MASVLDSNEAAAEEGNTDDGNAKHVHHKFILEINDNSEGKDVNEHEIFFTGYNGPSLSAHATKKLMLPFFNSIAGSTVASVNAADPLAYVQFKQVFSEFINDELKTIGVEEDGVQVREHLKEYNYQITAKLGLTYFYGKSFNWNTSYLLREVEQLRKGNTANIQNIQRNASLSSCFNSCKSIENIEKFKLQIKQRGYRLLKNTRQFYVKLLDRSNKQIISLSLDGDFKITSVQEDSSLVINVDIVRDRSKSLYKIAGTYLDIFDLRFQIVKTKVIDPKNYRDVLNLTSLTENQAQRCIDSLLVRVGDNDSESEVILNPHLHHKVLYMKEMNTEIFKLPTKRNSSTEAFTENFCLKIDNITEYKKSYDKNKAAADHLYKRVMIANSIVEFAFDVNNWILASLKLKEKFDDSMKEVSKYIYNELIAASDIANKCQKTIMSASSLESDYSTRPWVFGVVPAPVKKETNQKPNLQYAFNNKLINHESLSLIKRILFSKTHLDIFGIGIDSDFIDGFSDLDINREYRKMMSLILEDDKFEIKTEEDLEKYPFNGAGISKLAYKKLNNAYFTLKDPIKRELYVTNLKSQRKYQPRNGANN